MSNTFGILFGSFLGIGLAIIIISVIGYFTYHMISRWSEKQKSIYDSIAQKKRHLLLEMSIRIDKYHDSLYENPSTLLTVLMPSTDKPDEKLNQLKNILNTFSYKL